MLENLGTWSKALALLAYFFHSVHSSLFFHSVHSSLFFPKMMMYSTVLQRHFIFLMVTLYSVKANLLEAIHYWGRSCNCSVLTLISSLASKAFVQLYSFYTAANVHFIAKQLTNNSHIHSP